MKYTVIIETHPDYESSNVTIHVVDANGPAGAEEAATKEANEPFPANNLSVIAVYAGELKNLV